MKAPHFLAARGRMNPWLGSYWLLLLICLFSTRLSAQQDTFPSTAVQATTLDSLIAKTPKARKPGQALKWALIPGGGQVYNKAWWKVPIVYGGLIGAIGVADFNTTNYRRFVTALEAECFGNNIPADCVPQDHEFTGLVNGTQALRNLRDRFDRDRQNAYLFVFIAYLLQGIEAYSDAHLKSFDVSDDLSFRLQPTVLPGQELGLSLCIPLGRNKKTLLPVGR